MSDHCPSHEEQAATGVYLWDQINEPYENFLERIGPERAEMLAEGHMFLANGRVGLDHMNDIFAKCESQQEAEAAISKMTMDELGQMDTHMKALEGWLDLIRRTLKERGRELHREECETCREAYENGEPDALSKALSDLVRLIMRMDEDE